MCGLQGIRYVVKKKRSTCGRRVGEGVLGDAGYAGLKVCHQSVTAWSWTQSVLTRSTRMQTKRLDRLDEILLHWVVVRSSWQKQA